MIRNGPINLQVIGKYDKHKSKLNITPLTRHNIDHNLRYLVVNEILSDLRFLYSACNMYKLINVKITNVLEIGIHSFGEFV